MQLSISHEAGTAHLAVAGELDLASSRGLEAALRQAVDEGAQRVRLDLSRCTFIDSSGLGLLLRWREDCQANQRQFEVTGAQGAVRRVFAVAGVLGDAGA